MSVFNVTESEKEKCEFSVIHVRCHTNDWGILAKQFFVCLLHVLNSSFPECTIQAVVPLFIERHDVKDIGIK